MSSADEIEPFREHLFRVAGDRVLLVGSRCRSCGAQAFPQRQVCASCRSFDSAEEVELAEQGRLYAFAAVRQAPQHFSVPYVIGYVDTDDGVRVFTRIEVDDPASLRLGARMRCVLGELAGPESSRRSTYAFQPVDED